MIAKMTDFVQTLAQWAKEHEVEFILGIGVALVSLLSFAVGYITAKEQLKEPIQIEKSEIRSTKSQINSND
jgi:predicted DNA-binding protein with PD1-like motif